MRRKVFAVLAAVEALGLTGVAAAAVINGTPGDDVLRGTERACFGDLGACPRVRPIHHLVTVR